MDQDYYIIEMLRSRGLLDHDELLEIPAKFAAGVYGRHNRPYYLKGLLDEYECGVDNRWMPWYVYLAARALWLATAKLEDDWSATVEWLAKEAIEASLGFGPDAQEAAQKAVAKALRDYRWSEEESV